MTYSHRLLSLAILITIFNNITCLLFETTTLSGFAINVNIGPTTTTITAYVDLSQSTVWHAIGFGSNQMNNTIAIVQNPSTPATFHIRKLGPNSQGTVLDATASNWNTNVNEFTNPFVVTLTRSNDIGVPYYIFDPSQTTLDIIYAYGADSTTFQYSTGHGTHKIAETLVFTFPPTQSPITNNPTRSPTTSVPTISPTNNPSINPTKTPTSNPTISPSNPPSTSPTLPTYDPTTDPTIEPTPPTDSPSTAPTQPPTLSPSTAPTHPTYDPTNDPTNDPTSDPTNDPTTDPTFDPSNDPTTDPTNDPTSDPTTDPTNDPTTVPTHNPTTEPTFNPTNAPTGLTTDPTNAPTFSPTSAPTNSPTYCKMATFSVKMVLNDYLWSDKNDTMVSPDCGCRLMIHKDGNLIMYEDGIIKWETGTRIDDYTGEVTARFGLNDDGRVVVKQFAYKNIPMVELKAIVIWKSGNDELENTNNLVIYLTNVCCMDLVLMEKDRRPQVLWSNCQVITSTDVIVTDSTYMKLTGDDAVGGGGTLNGGSNRNIKWWVWLIIGLFILCFMFVCLIFGKRYRNNSQVINSQWVTSSVIHKPTNGSMHDKYNDSISIDNDCDETTKQIDEWMNGMTINHANIGEIGNRDIQIMYQHDEKSVELQPIQSDLKEDS